MSTSRDPHGPAGRGGLLPTERRVRVLVADDDGLARGMMRAALDGDERTAIVLGAGDGREAVELARHYRPGVVVVDLGLPPAGGVEVITEVLRFAPDTRVLSIAVDDASSALIALRAGAVGHIDKDVGPAEFARLVMRAAEGEAIVPPAVLAPLLELVRGLPDSGWRPLHSRLTTREWEIVELIESGATTDRMAELLVLSQATVYSHIKSLMRKLDVRSRQDAVSAAARLRGEEVMGEKHPTARGRS